MAFKEFADMSSWNVYNFSYKQKAIVWLRVVYPLLLDQNQHCFLLNKSKEEMCSFMLLAYEISVCKICNISPTEMFT